jgi:hypothetical protein
LTKSADELMTATTLEAGEDNNLLIYCVSEGATDIFGKRKILRIQLQFDRKILDGQ